MSAFVLDALGQPAHQLGPGPAVESDDGLCDDDLHLALYLCYELHYRSFADVDGHWEWEPSLLGFRRRLEEQFEAALRSVTPASLGFGSDDVEAGVRAVLARGNGRSLSSFMKERGTVEQFREFAVHRSAYQLKEADPHTWGIPRLSGPAKAALVEIQADEYGGGREKAMHSVLFAQVLETLGLDSSYGAYLDLLPGSTLATVNLISLFGLHRRWRGALIGHLAVFEMASVVPMGRYAVAVDRLGLGPGARTFYDVHVTADAYHEVVAVEGLLKGLARTEPALVPDILFGAAALMASEARFAEHLLDSWADGTTSLRRPVEPPAPKDRAAPRPGSSPAAPMA